MVLQQGILQGVPLPRRLHGTRSVHGNLSYSLAYDFLHCPSAEEPLGSSASSSATRAEVVAAATASASCAAATVAAALGAGSASLPTNPGHPSLLLAGFSGFQAQPQRVMRLQNLDTAGERLGTWTMEEHWNAAFPDDVDERMQIDPWQHVSLPELLATISSRGVGQAHGADHARHHAEHVAAHDEHDQVGNLATAFLTSSTTVLLAMLCAAFAVRLVREMMRPASSPLVFGVAGADQDIQGLQLQVDVPGVQPFRPFAGQGYRLQAEAPDEKPGGNGDGRSSEKPGGNADGRSSVLGADARRL